MIGLQSSARYETFQVTIAVSASLHSKNTRLASGNHWVQQVAEVVNVIRSEILKLKLCEFLQTSGSSDVKDGWHASVQTVSFAPRLAGCRTAAKPLPLLVSKWVRILHQMNKIFKVIELFSFRQLFGDMKRGRGIITDNWEAGWWAGFDAIGFSELETSRIIEADHLRRETNSLSWINGLFFHFFHLKLSWLFPVSTSTSCFWPRWPEHCRSEEKCVVSLWKQLGFWKFGLKRPLVRPRPPLSVLFTLLLCWCRAPIGAEVTAAPQWQEVHCDGPRTRSRAARGGKNTACEKSKLPPTEEQQVHIKTSH